MRPASYYLLSLPCVSSVLSTHLLSPFLPIHSPSLQVYFQGFLHGVPLDVCGLAVGAASQARREEQ